MSPAFPPTKVIIFIRSSNTHFVKSEIGHFSLSQKEFWNPLNKMKVFKK